jgi:hypothetical protein
MARSAIELVASDHFRTHTRYKSGKAEYASKGSLSDEDLAIIARRADAQVQHLINSLSSLVEGIDKVLGRPKIDWHLPTIARSSEAITEPAGGPKP